MMIDSEQLKARIKSHKENVKCQNPEHDKFYQLAHDHILELVEIEELRTQTEVMENAVEKKQDGAQSAEDVSQRAEGI